MEILSDFACRHVDIDKMYVYNRKLRARANYVGVIALFNS